MKPEPHSIFEVLQSNTTFFIPPFQRAYAWGTSEIERFFSDVTKIIDSELDINQVDKLEHFFGTLVIKNETEGFATKSIVIDGQQRLTTTLLLLIALRDIEDNEIIKKQIVETFLTSNLSSFQDKIKLKQVTRDWDSYRALINGEEVSSGVIKNAYEKFKKLLSDKKRLHPEITANHYLNAIRKLNVAVIFLDERPFKGEDPQIIFETLNSLGKPLTLSDLIRNYVLLNMSSNNQSDIYEKTWYPKIEQNLKEKSSDFFRDFLQLKTASQIKVVSDNNTKEIYAAFKDFVEENYSEHKNFIDDIVSYVTPYKWIIEEKISDVISAQNENDKEIKELLRNIFHDIKTEAFKPLVLGLLHCYQSKSFAFSDETLISQLKTIRTYLIRRRITKITQGENKNIVLLCSKINDLAERKVELIKLLSTQFYRLRLPNDDEIRKVLSLVNFYDDYKAYSKFILGKIEEHNTKVAVDFRNPKITIEHIMPQSLSDDWKTELGEKHEEVYKSYLHNIGNLILTEFNSEIGNKSFAEKKTKLQESSLFYRLDIIKKDKWNEEAVIEHQERMINWFLETFPLPDEYKNASNWNTKEAGELSIESFSPLDDDAGEIAEGNKPSKLTIGNESYKVSSWQEVFVKFIKYFYDSESYDFQTILDNQEELFGKYIVVIRNWISLREFISENEKFSNRYKSLDGKFWNKIEDLKDNEIFVHTNISAQVCMNRLTNVMNKFNIAEDFVTITLR